MTSDELFEAADNDSPKESRTGKCLCYRCEHRALFLEAGLRHRLECGDTSSAKSTCYMYRPVQPVRLKPLKGDRRPKMGPWMFSARMVADGLAEGELVGVTLPKGGYTAEWRLKRALPRKKATKGRP